MVRYGDYLISGHHNNALLVGTVGAFNLELQKLLSRIKNPLLAAGYNVGCWMLPIVT